MQQKKPKKKWDDIEREYITTDILYRKLADKYQVLDSSVFSHAKQGRWAEKRQERLDKTTENIIQKVIQKDTDRYERINCIADNILDKLEQDVAEIDTVALVNTTK